MKFDHDTPAAAEYIDVPAETLKQWRSLGRGPKYRKLPNGKVRYSREHLDEYSERHVVDPHEQAA